HRERLGYTGDGQITARAAMMMLDSKELYRKWIRDILDSQDKETGHVQHTAPFQGGGGGPGGWCSAIVTVPYAFAKEFGYDSILDDALPGMLRWIRFTESCTLDGLVVRESEGGWCLGDWCALDSAILPEPFVNSCWLIHALRLYCELSAFLGHTPEEDVIALEKRTLAATKAAYASLRGIGAAMAYAAWIGIEDAAHVAAHYGEKRHFDTGFLGTDILCDVLFKNGYGEVAYRLFTSEQLGSFLYMKRRGASTLWENWRGDNSHSHPMFGACARQLFEGILGIRQPKGSFGYEQVTVTPCLPEGMQHVEGKLTTPRGIISVKVRRTANGVCNEIDIPQQ
ncbi:MAG: hypothetical protein IJW69_04885, partial [Clostridia bacterium]|nr:hypothetical protein [Clostridia bacterium]